MADQDEIRREDSSNAGQISDQNVVPVQGSVSQPNSQNERQPTRMETFMAVAKSLILRALVIYFIMSFFRRPAAPESNPSNLSRSPSTNIFDNGTNLDLYFYMSEKEIFKDFTMSDALIWKLEGVIYGDWYGGPEDDGSFSHVITFKPSDAVKGNGSIYLHAYAVPSNRSPDPSNPKYLKEKTIYAVKQLNKYKKRKYQKTHNLLTGETALTQDQQRIANIQKGEIVSHWHPNLTVNFVTDFTNWVPGSVPPPLNEYVEFVGAGNRYKPPLFMNDFWNMIRDYQPINDTIEELTLRLTYQPISLFRWQMYLSQSIKNKWYAADFMGDSYDDEEDKDSLKEALLETSPYLLAATFIVSILHSVFELLAFKNDIQFWNNRKSLEGLSVRSVFFNVFQSLIVLLFVLDNDTNTIVRISCFVGLAIELWKINKVIDIQINRDQKYFGIIPHISFKDKGSYVESSTREYDMMAFKYLSWAIYPLLIGYGIYSLLYQEHKGWYSWVLSMLYGFLLTFGFIMMTPQLFINYKLKSVAHLPWRMMTYKALNTFIDDIFAFVIKMPTMYRIGCLRDDIVFFIFLYQRFIYKTDHSRINEFGFSGEMEDADKTAVNGVDSKKIN